MVEGMGIKTLVSEFKSKTVSKRILLFDAVASSFDLGIIHFNAFQPLQGTVSQSAVGHKWISDMLKYVMAK